MEILLPDRFHDARTGYGYVRTIFDQVASGTRPATVSITPSTRHVGVTRRDTFRPGFSDAIGAAGALGYPVLVRSSGGGATAADLGTFGFSIIRPADERESGRAIKDRYDEAASFVLAAFSRLEVAAEVGEVRDEFCPGDHSIRIGDSETGMKVVGIAQRITRRATSVGGIVLVEGEYELARVLEGIYGAMSLPFRPESVGSLHRAGYEGSTLQVIEAFAIEAERIYDAIRTPVDEKTLGSATSEGEQYLVEA